MIQRKAFLSLLIIGGFFLSCKEDKKSTRQVTTAPIEFKKEAEVYLVRTSGDTLQHLDIEIADDDYQRETGLMYRTTLEKNHGMLFIFENEQPRSFYMKNTNIPLDLIFLNADNKIVSIRKNAKPQSTQTIESEVPAQYVLEINAGLSEEWNLKAGDSLILNREH